MKAIGVDSPLRSNFCLPARIDSVRGIEVDLARVDRLKQAPDVSAFANIDLIKISIVGIVAAASFVRTLRPCDVCG